MIMVLVRLLIKVLQLKIRINHHEGEQDLIGKTQTDWKLGNPGLERTGRIDVHAGICSHRRLIYQLQACA